MAEKAGANKVVLLNRFKMLETEMAIVTTVNLSGMGPKAPVITLANLMYRAAEMKMIKTAATRIRVANTWIRTAKTAIGQ